MKSKIGIALGLKFICVAGAVAMGLMMSSQLWAMSGQNSNNNAGGSWDNWRALSGGFVGRRKIPVTLDNDVTERRLQNVDERLDRVMLLIEREKENLADGAGNANRLANLNRRIQRLERRKNNLNNGTTNRRRSLALWLRNQDEGLINVPLREAAETMGYSHRVMRYLAYRGRLSVSNENQPVPWFYYRPTDSIMFVGEKYNTFFTDQNAYRFQLGRTSQTKRFRYSFSRSRIPRTLGASQPYTETLTFEEEPDLFFSLASVRNDPDADFWFWDFLFPGVKDTITLDLDIPSAALTGTAEIKVTLRGFTNVQPGDEHEVYAELNGQPIGESLIWDGFEEAVLTASFDQSLLKTDGTKDQLVLKNRVQPGVPPGQFLDKIDISYQRIPAIIDGEAWLRSVGGGVQRVDGLQSRRLVLIQSPSSNPVLRYDYRLRYRGGGQYSILFTTQPGEEYLIAELGKADQVAMEIDTRSRLKRRGNAADYMIVAPREFAETARALANLRRNDYGNVRIVWLNEIYDEFSAGRVDPYALPRFFEEVNTNWRLAPSTVVIVGKGSLDHKDRMGFSDSFVPVVMTETPWSLTASDFRLIDADSRDVSFGRIPITSDEQGLAYVEKIRRQQQQIESPQPALYQAVLVADNPDDAGDFHTNSDILGQRLQDDFGFDSVNKQYHPSTPSVSSQMQLDSTWETGLVSYDGHGSATQVGNSSENFILADNVKDLQNVHLPIFASLTCAAGDFTVPGMSSVASAMVLNPDGGAIAAYSPTGLSLDSDAQAIGHAFLDSLYGSGNRIGDAVKDARLATDGAIQPFMQRMYSVVGDPAIYAR